MNYGGGYGGMLNDGHSKYSKRKGGFVPRMSSFHGVIAWCLLLATLLWSVKTRSSLSQQLAEMRQFSSASESETFEKMSRMTKQIADKNKEIGDLNKTQRANQRTIADLQTQKTALEANLQAAKEETVRCTQREASLQTELSDCKLGCEKELDSHGEVHRSKDAEIEELKRQVQILVDQAQKNAERVPSSTDNGQQEQKKEQKKEQKMEQKMEQKKEQQGQMEPPTPPGQMETDNVQYETQQDDTVPRPAAKQGGSGRQRVSVTPIPHDGEHLKKKKKRTPSKLEQDIGVYEADEEYLYGR